LVFKLENLTGDLIENKTPKSVLPLVDLRTAIINGKAVKLETPEYTAQAKESCAAGKVEVLTLIHSRSGEVISAKATTGDETLSKASENAVLKSKFAPSNINGNDDFYVLSKVVYNFDAFAKCISAGIVNKRALNLPKPKVLNLGRPHLQIKEEQIVAVQIVVDVNGNVTAASALTGHPLLRAGCLNAARQAKFSPTFINGPPLRVRALLVYKFKPDGTIETDIESDNKDVVKTPVSLLAPTSPFCNCRGLGGSVLVEVKIGEQGTVTQANAWSGHPLLRKSSEVAALESKFLPTGIKAKILISYNFEASDKEGRTAKFKDFEIKEVKIIEENDETIIGKALNLAKPPFPSTFNGRLDNNLTVLVEAKIDENGNVISAKSISGHPVLRAACEAAARVSKFSQTTVTGVPVKAKTLLTYEFTLDDEITVNVIANGVEADNE
jgi:hypothetical protein